MSGLSAVLFLALFAALGVSLSDAICQGEAAGKVFVVQPHRCWYFCRRNYGKGGECETGTENARCICDGSGGWLDVGACKRNAFQTQGTWIENCDEHCKQNEGKGAGGECTWTFTGYRCNCKFSDDDVAPACKPRSLCEPVA